MSNTRYGKGITTDGLRILLAFWPKLSADVEKAQQKFIEDKGSFLSKDAKPLAWCHLYELPVMQHVMLASNAIVHGYDALLQTEQAADWIKQLIVTPGQIGALPGITNQIGHHVDAMNPSNEDFEKYIPNVAGNYALGLSMYNSLRCVLYHGCYLNVLIERVRNNDEKALFKAIRIDPTVIGCKSVLQQISIATLTKNEDFLKKLKNAINGKPAKREQEHYQLMRLVLEVLHEAGATRLNDEQLYRLFVEELNLYPWNDVEGGNPEALRKFANTYMKKNATT